MTIAKTRERIIDAASAALAETGLTGTTTREVARRAGVSEGAIYVHFHTKTELLAAVIRERLLQPAVDEMPPPDPHDDVRAVLGRLVSGMLTGLDRSIPLLAAALSDPTLGDAILRQAPGPATWSGSATVTSYLRAQQAAGLLGDQTDAAMLTRLLFAGAFHQAYLKRAFGEERLRPRGAAFVRGLVDAVLSAAGPPTGPQNVRRLPSARDGATKS